MSLDPEPETPMNILRPSQFAKKLGVSARTAGLWIARRYFDERDELVELAVSVHPAERFSYRESFRRDWH